MTEQKKLKQRVRARMAATGESWTSARRQVLAHAEPSADRVLPPGLVPGYRTFGPRQHRESGLLAHVLAAQGVRAPHTDAPYTEAMLAGLGGGVGFMYAVFEYRDLPPLLTIVAQHHPQPWVPAALDRLGLPYVEEHSSKAGPAIDRLRTALGGGRPVFATVDRSRLPWHGLEPGPATTPIRWWSPASTGMSSTWTTRGRIPASSRCRRSPPPGRPTARGATRPSRSPPPASGPTCRPRSATPSPPPSHT
ncbi:BtrH N-terminal domain-containing protein [Micromonospora sp. A200]|uniref:BtrH N-terminal domain-containing protein n=1 Tax=Micromonospora sp. A200 TaxID=2940568 RepID=UPI0024772D44|nr:BtrH N-terminal domain-containing protein [Micromonospora sp. A200]